MIFWKLIWLERERGKNFPSSVEFFFLSLLNTWIATEIGQEGGEKNNKSTDYVSSSDQST